MWESNLLGADFPSTYEEALGRNWKDLASSGTLIAAFLPPRLLIPLFVSEEPFRRPCCWPPAWHRAPLAYKYSSSCECPNAAEVLVEPSSPLATNGATSNTNGGRCANLLDQVRHGAQPEAGGRVESSTATADVLSRMGSGTTNRNSLLPEKSRPCTQVEDPPNSDALAIFCSSSWS